MFFVGNYNRWPGTSHQATAIGDGFIYYDNNFYGFFNKGNITGGGETRFNTSRNNSGVLSPNRLVLAYGGPFDRLKYNFGGEYNGSYLMLVQPFIFEQGLNKILGTLPGFFYHAHHYNSFANLQEITHDDRTFINIKGGKRMTSSAPTCVDILLETGVYWG